MQAIIIETTIDDESIAKQLADRLIEEKLAACVQLSQVQSTFVWNGQAMRDDEWLLRIKTLDHMFDAVSEWIRANHSYDVPEIIGTPISRISSGYLEWMRDQIEE